MRRALIVGLDDYPKFPLFGCVNDAKKIEKVLSRHYDGSLNFQCELLTAPSSQITRPILRNKLSELFRQPADVAFFHFSGHGTISGLGGYLVTIDFCENDVGIPMTEILAMANESPVGEIFITLDCCHSGIFGTIPEISNDKIFLSEGISIITATRPEQEALEEGGGGVFTSLLVEALEGSASGLLGDVSAANIYAYIDNAMGAWNQRPLFKSNVSRFSRLRNASPKITIDILRLITQYFPLPAESFDLSPEHEPEAIPHNEEKETFFKNLVKLRHVGLVEPCDEEHMYYAAINSKACRLTSLGKYYWRLVKENKI